MIDSLRQILCCCIYIRIQNPCPIISINTTTNTGPISQTALENLSGALLALLDLQAKGCADDVMIRNIWKKRTSIDIFKVCDYDVQKMSINVSRLFYKLFETIFHTKTVKY